MIRVNEASGREATRVFGEAINGTPGDRWKTFLRSRSAVDGFATVLNGQHPAAVFGLPDCPESLDGWLLSLATWREKALRIVPEPEPRVVALFALWEAFQADLCGLLRQARLSGLLPNRGGVLAFVGAISKCVVVRYEMFGETPRLDIVAVINEPRSAFDFWGALDDVDARARNYLKGILATGHKVVYHRGTLIHVDRRADVGVFGPSIDTVLLSEILAQEVLDPPDTSIHAILEIGCGSGMLAAALLRHTAALERLVGVDIDFPAVACTWRNCRIAEMARSNRVDLHLVHGPFRPDLVGRDFDLVVCNPPYIPDPQAEAQGGTTADFYRAVGGTTLVRELLSAAPSLLNESGRLLMMLSNLCLEEAQAHVPDGWRLTHPLGDQGFEVLFDVEAVLERPEWREFLTQERGLIERSGSFFHVLHPVWLKRA